MSTNFPESVGPETERDAAQAPANREQVFFVVRHRVKADAHAAYESWLTRISRIAAGYPGHLGVQVTRPPRGHHDYVAVVRFANDTDARRWQSSAERQGLVDEVQALLDTAEQIDIHSGIDYWFTPPESYGHPPKWKQWLVTSSVIWPLTMLVPWLLDPLFAAVPMLGIDGVRHGIVAVVIVALVVYIVMPRYVRLLSAWFFKA